MHSTISFEPVTQINVSTGPCGLPPRRIDAKYYQIAAYALGYFGGIAFIYSPDAVRRSADFADPQKRADRRAASIASLKAYIAKADTRSANPDSFSGGR